MSKGILFFAQNNNQIDYAKMACIAAQYAKKNLNVPVSIVTDIGTKTWTLENNKISLEDVFDNVIVIEDKKLISNPRRYYDGALDYKKAEFKNIHRSRAYEFTPYDKTLVVDVDLLIVNDRLNAIWDTDETFMINKYSHDLSRDRNTFEFTRVSDHGIDFFWATAFYFQKTPWTKAFFGLCQHIVENYDYYRFIYRIDNPLMRNDYVFSIAVHMMGGFTNRINPPALPCEIYYTLDRDELLEVNDDKTFTFLIQKKNYLGQYTLAKTSRQNIHIMNKFSIDRHSKKLLEVLDGN